VRELAITLKVNPNTIQRTYQELEREGIAETQRGLGRYVTEDGGRTQLLKDEMCHALIQSFIKEMRALGFADDTIIQMMSNKLEGAGNG
ncbi:MAG TPA: GntR family transcriptional regulator, partial [Epulopiscium sp.]|nr:GntR family transcriptional regulator [Candidatus Epulonipiscium sp.]